MAAHHKRRLTDKEKQAIVADRRHMTLRAVARKYKVSTTTVHRLARREL